MVNIRPCILEDLFAMQNCNVSNLPENYQMKYYFYHFLSWPQLLYIAETDDLKTTGYVLAKMNEESESAVHGHITSLAVSRTQRKQGVAQRLMAATHQAMQDTFNAEYSSLHVRISNRAASSLYASFGYKTYELEKKYYADQEDALGLRCMFPYGEKSQALRLEAKQKKNILDGGGIASGDDVLRSEQKASSQEADASRTKRKKNKKKK